MLWLTRVSSVQDSVPVAMHSLTLVQATYSKIPRSTVRQGENQPISDLRGHGHVTALAQLRKTWQGSYPASTSPGFRRPNLARLRSICHVRGRRNVGHA